MKKVLLIIAIIFLLFQMVVLATAIDIGNAAIDRPSGLVNGTTYVDRNNPANATGVITSIEVWALQTMTAVDIATFYVVSGNNLSTRDTHYVESITAGSKQTFEVNLNVEEGDFIGVYYNGGYIEADVTTAATGVWYDSGDHIPCTDNAFTAQADRTISLYGTGTTEEEEANVIFFGTSF